MQYGLTTAYGNSTALDSSLLASHSVALSNLTPGTIYHYRILSKDAAGNTATSEDGTFSTFSNDPDIIPLNIPPVIPPVSPKITPVIVSTVIPASLPKRRTVTIVPVVPPKKVATPAIKLPTASPILTELILLPDISESPIPVVVPEPHISWWMVIIYIGRDVLLQMLDGFSKFSTRLLGFAK